MKKLFTIFLLLILVGCSKQQRIFNTIQSECLISFTKDKTGDGRDFYYAYLNENEFYSSVDKVKGIIDRKLDCLPSEVRKEAYNEFDKYIYDYYEWETPSIKLVMQADYNKPNYKIRIWVTEK